MTSTRESAPSYYMPSEQDPHIRTLMSWPDATVGWGPSDLLSAQREVASIANAIAKYEPVWLYVKSWNAHTAAKAVSDNVTIKEMEVEDLWMRDIGPIFVTNKDAQDQVGIDFNFNHWGNKINLLPCADRSLARNALAQADVQRLASSIVLEGGGLEVDGKGTLIATESSIINPNRNPAKSKAEIDEELRRLLGLTKIIRLPGIKDIEITDCHINLLARFGPDSRTILLSRPNNAVPATDVRHKVYEEALHILSSETNADGEKFDIKILEEALTVSRKQTRPTDQIVLHQEDEWVPATSCANFYFVNGGIIVPQFGEERTDDAAVQRMKKLFPDRVIEPVKLDFLAYAGGGMHCATQQWPEP